MNNMNDNRMGNDRMKSENLGNVNDDVLKGQWKQIRGEARKTFGKLTDDDMEVIGGNLESFIGKVQERYGYTREKAANQVRDFTSGLGDRFNNTGDSASNARERSKDAVSDAWDRTLDAASDAVDSAKDTANPDVDRVERSAGRNFSRV